MCLKDTVTLGRLLEQAPGRTRGLMERGAHPGEGFLAGLVTLEGTHTEAVCEELHPMEVTHIRGIFQVCLPWKGFHTKAG